MASQIHIRVDADTSQAQTALLSAARGVIRLDYGVPWLSNEGADLLIEAERQRAQDYFQTADFPPLLQVIGREILKVDELLHWLIYGGSWKQVQLKRVLDAENNNLEQGGLE